MVLLTPTALLTISAVDYQGVGVALQRAGWSALGIAIGVAVAQKPIASNAASRRGSSS